MMEWVNRLIEESDPCPACGEPMIDPNRVPGYDERHCRDCAQAIEKRRDWLDRRAGSA
jgi:formylmethanofuran dehydrogenase subunit E